MRDSVEIFGTHAKYDTIYVVPFVPMSQEISTAQRNTNNIPPVHTLPATGGLQPRIPRVQYSRIQLLPTPLQLRNKIVTYSPTPTQVGGQYQAWTGRQLRYTDTSNIRPTWAQISEIKSQNDINPY